MKKKVVWGVLILVGILLVTGGVFLVIRSNNSETSYEEKEEVEEQNEEIKDEVKDEEAPVITGLNVKEIYQGDSIDLLEGIEAIDNVDGVVLVTTNDSIDTNIVGEYTITVEAVDKALNKATGVYKVIVKAKEEDKADNKTFESSEKVNEVKIVKTETIEDVVSTEEKYGIVFKTIKKTIYNVYSDGSKEIKNTNTYQNVDRSGFRDDINEMKTEASQIRNTYVSEINEVLKYTNEYRKELGVEELVLEEDLTLAATIRAMEMAYGDEISHTRPNGKSCFTVMGELGIFEDYVGENIAYGQISPYNATLWWRNSPGHYANMTNTSFKGIGIGVFKYNGKYYWVQVFNSEI